MKRILTAVLALLLSFSLVACASDDSNVKVLSPDETTDKFAFLEKQEVDHAVITTETETEAVTETDATAEDKEMPANTTAGDSSANENDSTETVYITDSGTKYHKDNCRHLAKSKIPILKSEAESQGYEPCKVCHPD